MRASTVLIFYNTFQRKRNDLASPVCNLTFIIITLLSFVLVLYR